MVPLTLDLRLPDPTPETLPVLPLLRGVLLPAGVLPLTIGRPGSVAALENARDGLVLVGVQREAVKEPSPADLLPILTLARVLETKRTPGGTQVVLVQGLRRARPLEFTSAAPYLEASYTILEEQWPENVDARALADVFRETVEATAALVDREKRFLPPLEMLTEPHRLADAVATLIEAEHEWKCEVLQTLDPVARTQRVLQQLAQVKELLATRQSIRDKVTSEAEGQQREALLRRQLKAIHEELGEAGDSEELEELRQRLDALPLDEEVRAVVDRELRRLERLGPQSAERSVAIDWLEWIADLPWAKHSAVDLDLDELERILDESHHGLDDVKRQVVEHLAVRKLAGSGRADVLLLVGPPGVGKTSIGQAIADATGRKLVRVALGGVHDEAELRGHRRTYIGARPGRLIEGLRRAGTADPVVLLDEVDKLGQSWRGNPAAALLEILDPEQNHSFTDHYLEVPFDLSKALFVATANDVTTIPGPLRDRMETLTIAGYTREEKVAIARKHLLETLAKNAGLEASDVELSDDVLRAVIIGWTREAGVRELQRCLGRIYRAAAVRKAKGQLVEPLVVDLDDLTELLKRPLFEEDDHEGPDRPGIATGLAWTATGGDVLYVEASTFPGSGKLVLTGHLGDVMKESARAALTYVLAEGQAFGVAPESMATRDLHVHVPAGAVPKDGPSAGVTMFTALTSLLSNRPVRADVAMTGEATLRGRVLPVGGIKSKVLAAHRRGLKRVILPRRNERDLADVPAEALAELEIILVDRMEEVLTAALEPPPAAQAVPPADDAEASARAAA
jgi:ATP-dependent Lon protease